MQEQVSQLEQKTESQAQILEGLMHLSAPSFAQSDSNEINSEVLEGAQQERNITDLLIDDKANENDYGILRTIAKNTHDEMELELLKALKKNDKATVLPLYNAATHGFPLQRCQHSWAAGLLLFETHKHRSNRARNKASVVERENNSRIGYNKRKTCIQ
ncbi:uncharacterized protein B0P05DRAFT_557999 [Gilbertella persicaria]|uniref:uncharacterized protein n=1 Tax=Gilbertella persicaria TaxID=101096 RepID=UPI00221EF67A|nr:uncharacterized protein B0P05DRAFT_557999 [Gilbertella persicaria]KAI8060403.1 hypothetical protein B0P05DRAFT_557999 [Gilbertella persicaria]